MAKKLIGFKWLPAAWGLHGSAFEEAEINYLYTGQERDIRLAVHRFGADTPDCIRRIITLSHQYRDIDDYECERQLASVARTGLDLHDALIDVECKFGRLSPYDAAVQKLTKRTESLSTGAKLAQSLGMLDIDLSFDRITRTEYDKRGATLREEPWVSVVNAGFDPKQGIDGVYFEFDWNSHWIEFLRLNGYVGYNDEQIVEDWFADVCRSHVQAEIAR